MSGFLPYLSSCAFLRLPAPSCVIAFVCLLFCGPLAPTDAAGASLQWDSGRQGGFVTALCRDRRGDVWVGTEGQGVWRFSRLTGHWTQFHGPDDYGEQDCCALTADRLGRVWCGGLHGLAVFTGSQWRRFTPLDGPPGFRVFCLTTDPVSGDVWGGTEVGLFRYSLSSNTWTDYSRLDGLPSDAIQSVAFSASGRLFVATQADGLAVASRLDGFRKWTLIPGPSAMPATPAGVGLPSALINCLFGASDGAVYAGTPCGLAFSHDDGQTWRYVRGADWRDKAQGEYHGPPPVETPVPGDLLTEDYVTCLSEDGAGDLWVGHRGAGWERRDARTGRRLASGASPDYLEALLPSEDSMLAGGYGAGLASLPDASGVPRSAQVVWLNTPGAAHPGCPLSAKPPTLSDLNALLKRLAAVPPEADPSAPFAVALDDDWQTRGDWLGRYGRYWACLCAMASPEDLVSGPGVDDVSYHSQIGSNSRTDDYLRYWVQWLYTTNPGSLELPPSTSIAAFSRD